MQVGISCAPADLDLQVASFDPATLLQPCMECGHPSLCISIVRGGADEHPDAPNALALL